MAEETIRVVGARELRTKLRKLGDELEDMKAIHKEAADIGADEARLRVPVKTGASKGSIKSSGTKTKGIIRAASTGRSKAYGARQHWVQQQGKPGDQFVFKAVGATGRKIVKVYVDRVDDLVERMNRSGTRGDF